jgi:PPK2 family polyphosphate:nucleotide phosphotransferase
MAKSKQPELKAFQHGGASSPRQAAATTRPHSTSASFNLSLVDPASKPFSSGDKARDKAATAALAAELDVLQELFYADRRFKLLVVLQGTDTSGKDGTIRGVFGQMSALGVHTVGWKAPSEDERAHDFLWRIHKAVPAAGEMVIFNRSHYEDVLVPVVGGSLTAEATRQRYQQINDFERMLTETGTVVLKFLLLISREEQGKRLQERIDDPSKRWKFAPGDLDVRKRWDDYEKAYADAVSATGTAWAPWTVVPADSKTHRNLMVATVLKQTLQGLDLHYPPGDPSLATLRIE